MITSVISYIWVSQIQLATHTEFNRCVCVSVCGSVHFVDGCWGRTLLFSTWGRRTIRWEWWSSMIRAFTSRWAPRRPASITESPLRTSAGRHLFLSFTFCCDGIAAHCWLRCAVALTKNTCVMCSISLCTYHKGLVYIVWGQCMLSPPGSTNKDVLDGGVMKSYEWLFLCLCHFLAGILHPHQGEQSDTIINVLIITFYVLGTEHSKQKKEVC